MMLDQLLSWIPPHAVSNAMLDVAFAEQEPLIAVNLVHPRPVAWKALMRPIADAIFEHKLTSVPLPLVPFSEWLEKLESCAKDASEETMKRIVRVLQWLSRTASYRIFDCSLPSSFLILCDSELNQTWP
jgi:hypothetical protein